MLVKIVETGEYDAISKSYNFRIMGKKCMYPDPESHTKKESENLNSGTGTLKLENLYYEVKSYVHSKI